MVTRARVRFCTAPTSTHSPFLATPNLKLMGMPRLRHGHVRVAASPNTADRNPLLKMTHATHHAALACTICRLMRHWSYIDHYCRSATKQKGIPVRRVGNPRLLRLFQVTDAGDAIELLEDLDNPASCPTSFTSKPSNWILRTTAMATVANEYFVTNSQCGRPGLIPTPTPTPTRTPTLTPLPVIDVAAGSKTDINLMEEGSSYKFAGDVAVSGTAIITGARLVGSSGSTLTFSSGATANLNAKTGVLHPTTPPFRHLNSVRVCCCLSGCGSRVSVGVPRFNRGRDRFKKID